MDLTIEDHNYYLTLKVNYLYFIQNIRSSYRRQTMCRNIRPLYNFEPPASEEEIRAAALQYVRKISGFQRPSRANQAAFDAAVDAVAAASAVLLAALETSAAPKDRAVEAARAQARSLQRFSKGETV